MGDSQEDIPSVPAPMAPQEAELAQPPPSVGHLSHESASPARGPAHGPPGAPRVGDLGAALTITPRK